jgi:hypothetical protein
MLFLTGCVADGNGVVRFGPLRMWAERGLIHVEDARDNSYDSMSVNTALERMQAISDTIRNSKRDAHSESQFDKEWRYRNQQMLDDMILACNKAQVQGMPSDESARRDLVRRAKKLFVVPGMRDAI